MVALGDDPAVHELDRADVQAAGWLAGDQHLVLAADLPGQDDLLLVAARQGTGRGGGGPGADVELGDELFRVLRDLLEVEVDARGERPLVVRIKNEILGYRESPDEAVLVPVFGHVGDARP